jgi:hypothetical protein
MANFHIDDGDGIVHQNIHKQYRSSSEANAMYQTLTVKALRP